MQDLGIGYEKSGSSPNTQNVEEVLVSHPAPQRCPFYGCLNPIPCSVEKERNIDFTFVSD